MPGLPKNLISTYQKYKNNTDSIAQWLATTAKNRGYVSSKAKKSSKNTKTPHGRPTYTIPIREWTPMAEFIVALTDPPVDVPEKLAILLDLTIHLRQSYSEGITNVLADNVDEDSQRRHDFFLAILKTVRKILSPRVLAVPHLAEKPMTVKDIVNRFDNLELEEPSEAFENAPNASPVQAPIYKAERQSNLEDDFFALHLLFHDLSQLRTEHGGALKMLQVYYAANCVAAGTTERRKQRPGDDMNFAMYKVADAMMLPAFMILDAFTRMHKVNPHPEMKPGFYGTYDPFSNRDSKSEREKFTEDKILLLEILPEFYFHCRATKPAPPPVEDELTRGLRTMFVTKTVDLPLVFAVTLFLDIHHMLRAEVDDGFERLRDTTRFIAVDIAEEFEFHKDIEMEPGQKGMMMSCNNSLTTSSFGCTPTTNARPPCDQTASTSRNLFTCFESIHGRAESGNTGRKCNSTSLGGSSQTMMWKDMDVVIGFQQPKSFFTGDAPDLPDECLQRFALAMGASAANSAKSTRKKRGLTLSKRGPKGLKELGAILQTFRARICDANGPNHIRAEDVKQILEKCNWAYELDGHDHAQMVYKDVGEVPQKPSVKHLSVAKGIGLIRDLLYAEIIEIAFDYLRLHRQCWRLLRIVKETCRDDLIKFFGPDYIQKESQLPFVVGYVLLTASNSQQLGDLLKRKHPGLQVTSKVLDDAKKVVKVMIESGAGGLVVEHILPKGLGLQIDFEIEDESSGEASLVSRRLDDTCLNQPPRDVILDGDQHYLTARALTSLDLSTTSNNRYRASSTSAPDALPSAKSASHSHQELHVSAKSLNDISDYARLFRTGML
ncbi:hypothetical protein OPT61_g8231 [Boeremia exigua]|uniref:Uncharacterized protein n=1 Tax=Boeremia exigua TaxID=749465 RepID=A0ACC2HZ16_9PLEO|nr:hypothetical protein OPT61_g8231 [Boeremia exigua]